MKHLEQKEAFFSPLHAVRLRLALVCLPLLCAASCSLPAALGPDELPADLFRMGLPGSAREEVRVVAASDFGESRELRCPGGQSVLLEFAKNRPAAVLAYVPGGATPSGAIYPYTELLEEKDGFAAEILWELYAEGAAYTEAERENVRLFNWHKLLEALREQEDPWLVDSDRVKEAVRSGKFSKSKVKKWVKKPS